MPRTMTYKGKPYDVSDAHPAADVPPWGLDDPEFAGLVESMKAGGFDADRPITRQSSTGLVIDGRRRELAARVAGVEPVYTAVGWDNRRVCAWVEEELHRRNLTPSQRAAAIVDYAALRSHGANQHTEDSSRDESSPTVAELAETHRIGKRTMDAAVKVKKSAPELIPAVKEGKLPARVAEKVADLPKADRAKVAASADPKAEARKVIQTRPMPHETKARKGKPAPAGVGGPRYDWATWDRVYGACVREVDAIAKAHDAKGCTEHQKALEHAGLLLATVKGWRTRLGKGKP